VKRVFVLLVLFLSLGSMTLFAQDHNVSIGGGVYVANYLDGGFSEFEFMILKNESFDIRNHLIFRWVGLSDNLGEVMSLS
jgi:hypothetical protein